ncbi:DUF3238 domain-containing protein [Vibrio alginolyticus]|nr:DUF3238 domain-containing protein [Vibrio alginolyticus]
MKAFIPNEHPLLPNYIKKTSSGVWVIPAPSTGFGELSGSCFTTDNRTFNKDPEASARVTTEFVIAISGRELMIEKYGGRDRVRLGETKNVDCKTGKQLRPTEVEDRDSVSIGEVKKKGFNRVFFVRASPSNPFYKILGLSYSPAIDYSFVVTFNSLHRMIDIKGSTGYFPSFEAYYSVNSGPVIKILNREPHDRSTALSLTDLNLGVNTMNFEYQIKLD